MNRSTDGWFGWIDNDDRNSSFLQSFYHKNNKRISLKIHRIVFDVKKRIRNKNELKKTLCLEKKHSDKMIFILSLHSHTTQFPFVMCCRFIFKMVCQFASFSIQNIQTIRWMVIIIYSSQSPCKASPHHITSHHILLIQPFDNVQLQNDENIGHNSNNGPDQKTMIISPALLISVKKHNNSNKNNRNTKFRYSLITNYIVSFTIFLKFSQTL